MPKAGDPFYDRKPVPNEFIEHVGTTGLSPADETLNRERKFSLKGGDIRRFSNPKPGGKVDPFYQRKPVPDALIHGVGETGLSKEEEYLNRERKYSVGGTDLRKFGDNAKKGWHPTADPYYGRSPVKKVEIEGVGQTNMTAAEEFETRENKASLFEFSSDPFQQITGTGHRASVSGAAGPVAAAAARRRSSAVAPDHHHQPHGHHEHQHHSGYEGNTLQTIQSRVDGDEIRPSTEGQTNGSGGAYPTTAFAGTTGPTTTTTTTTTISRGLNPATSTSINPVTSSIDPAQDVRVRDNTGHQVGTTGHTAFYDEATKDLDSVGPHGER